MKDRTVFIVGAGASKEFNLPTGAELKNKISDLLSFAQTYYEPSSRSSIIFQTLELAVKLQITNSHIDDLCQKAIKIKQALPYAISIDNLIDAHKDDPDIALISKITISQAILQAEEDSRLRSNPPESGIMSSEMINQTWMLPFFKFFTESCKFEDLESRANEISFICFNYDRCIERFMYCSLLNYYSRPQLDTINIVNKLEILRPYGDVGNLYHWGEDEQITFGCRASSPDLLRSSKRLKTFTEGTNPNSATIMNIHSRVANAKKLVFLGFGYHDLNMSLLTPHPADYELNHNELGCFATSLGESSLNQQRITDAVREIFLGKRDVRIEMENLTCYEFFNFCSRGIAARS